MLEAEGTLLPCACCAEVAPPACGAGDTFPLCRLLGREKGGWVFVPFTHPPSDPIQRSPLGVSLSQAAAHRLPRVVCVRARAFFLSPLLLAPLLGCAPPLTRVRFPLPFFPPLTLARRVMSAVTTLAPDLLVEEPLPELEIDGGAAGAPPMTPQSTLPPVAGGAVESAPPAPPPVVTTESGALHGGAASAPPSQAATPMVVETARPEDLDWLVSPTHPTAMGEGGHLLSMYRTFPDSEQVTA